MIMANLLHTHVRRVIKPQEVHSPESVQILTPGQALFQYVQVSLIPCTYHRIDCSYKVFSKPD